MGAVQTLDVIPMLSVPDPPELDIDTDCIVCPNCDGLTMYLGTGCETCGTADRR